MNESMSERTHEYFRQLQNFFNILFAIVSLNLILTLQKSSHTASTKMKIIAKYNKFITMSLLLLINYRSPSWILLLNHIQYHVCSLVLNCLFGGSSHIVHYGKMMEKFKEALSYNDQYNLIVSNAKKKLSKVNMIITQDFQPPTDFFPTHTIDRIYSINNGGVYGEFSKELDI